MNINSISTQAFRAKLATLDEMEYTPKQKQLIRAVEHSLNEDTDFNYTSIKLQNITNRCYIFAKPVGKTGLEFQACVKNYDPFTEWTMWYDKFFSDGRTFATYPTRTSKDTIKAFDNLVDNLNNVNREDLLSTWDEHTESERKPMKNPPRKVNIIV